MDKDVHDKTKTGRLKLWYNEPAKATVTDGTDSWKDDPEWLKALPLGNGALGAMVFGDVDKERIQLNEESMWSGSPNNDNNPKAYPAQAKIRELLFKGKYREATKFTQETQICEGKGSGRGQGATLPFGCFQTLGDLWIDFENQGNYEDYYRELDLEDAIVRVSYTKNNVQYKRDVFVSEPDQLMVVRLTANAPGAISFTSSLSRPERFTTKVEDDQLVMFGALDNGKGGNGLEYMARLTALNKNGTVSYSDDGIVVQQADEVLLLLSASTNYVLDYPSYKGRDYEKLTAKRLENGKQKTYAQLLEAHTKDYQSYFKRVSLKLDQVPDTVPTNKRLQNLKTSKSSDLRLEELLFQYGRYLLISSSRPGTLPANLQGIWANKIQTPWNGDYHTDVNVQMNYWMAEVTNLNEMHLPLFDLMASLQEPGAITAKTHYNANGWVVHPITNIWGYTAPGEKASWGMHVGGGAWLTTHIMEHYYFNLDKTFLRQNYPVLKASTQFYMDWLVPDHKTGELVSGPSVSPENTFIAPDGSNCQISMGPAHDQQVIWQLFKNFIDASVVLGIDDDYVASIKRAQAQLAKPKIGDDGRLMEWAQAFEEVEPGHRHISHLFALHPGYQIDIEQTPKLAMAAKKSLDFRIKNGGGHTGWSAAWLISQYARLGEAEKAYKSLQTVLAKSTTSNLFGLHPPFQMDANFGTTEGISEMLLQSQSGTIRLLHALPDAWATGEVKGLCARGGFVIDMEWKDAELTEVKVHSKSGGTCKIGYKGKTIYFETQQGQDYFPLQAHHLKE
ncbi:glycoside hydrolase family 95 protein [Seonamhaeicola marinus]|nr:glycoside hydrolase family 95 protein [Seonamhaeicola marinus]